MRKDKFMISLLKKVFPARPIDKCLDFDIQERFYICEDSVTNVSYILRNGDEQTNEGFLVINPEQKEIYLLSIDNCFFTSHDEYTEQRCDCVVFDNRCFCFLELKLNAYEPKQAVKHSRKARKQLGAMIVFFQKAFDEASKSLSDFELEAFIAMRQNIYPKKRSSRDIIFVKFLEKYRVPLYEKNVKEF